MNGKKKTGLRPRDHQCVHSQCQFLSLGHPRQCLHCSSKWSSSPTPVHHTSNEKNTMTNLTSIFLKTSQKRQNQAAPSATITCSYIYFFFPTQSESFELFFGATDSSSTPGLHECQVTGFASHALHQFHGSPDVFRPERRSWRKRCQRQWVKHPVTSADSSHEGPPQKVHQLPFHRVILFVSSVFFPLQSGSLIFGSKSLATTCFKVSWMWGHIFASMKFSQFISTPATNKHDPTQVVDINFILRPFFKSNIGQKWWWGKKT